VVGRVSSERFVGREEYLAALDDVGTFLIVGDAGVGKSRLVAELERRATEDGKLALVGECLELTDGELPYAPIVSALRPVVADRGALAGLGEQDLRELARLWPELSPGQAPASTDGGGGASRTRLFSLLLGLLDRLAADRQLLFILEDLHWADQSTRDFVAFLVRAGRSDSLSIVITLRGEDVHRHHPLREFMTELARVRGVRRLELVPFTRQELALQLEGITGTRPSQELVERLFERSEGNAFYTEELLAAGEGTPLPISLRDLLLLRVERLPDPARRLLEVAATAERAVDERLLRAVAGLPDDQFDAGLRDALAHQVLVEVPAAGTYAFRHALVREAVYGDLLASRRRELHAAIAGVLARQPELAAGGVGAAGELAHHWEAAGEPSAALEAAVRASAEADAAFAFAETATHCDRALALWDQVPDAERVAGLDRAALLMRAADAAVRGDRPARSVKLAREAIGELIPERDAVRLAQVHMLLGRGLWLTADHESGLVAYREAVRLIPAEPPSAERAHVLAGLAQALMLSGQSTDALAVCEEALVLAREVGDRYAEARTLATMAGVGWSAGVPFENASEALSIAREIGAVEEIGRAYANGSENLDAEGRVREAIAFAEAGIADAPRWGLQDFVQYLSSSIAVWKFRLGEWEDVDRRIADISNLGSSAAVAPRQGVAGLLAMARGDYAAAEASLALAEPVARGMGGPEWLPPTLAAIGMLRLWQGRLDDAAATLAVAQDEVSDLAYAPWIHDFVEVYPTAARIAADRARLHAPKEAAARVAEAEHALAGVDAMLAQLPRDKRPPRAEAYRLLTVAEAARAGRRDDASIWEEVASAFRELEERYTLAYVLMRQADAHLAENESQAATRTLREAHGITTALGERPLRAEIEALAQRSRISLDESVEEPADPIADRGVTAREREVLVLLAEGASNREIAEALVISEKTASVHVSHILAKLGARNRAEAATIAHRLGLRSAEPA
jgi:DNA-binding CsgD family transcriptional regulator/tetratricopeptide (TPR) repeat protein